MLMPRIRTGLLRESRTSSARRLSQWVVPSGHTTRYCTSVASPDVIRRSRSLSTLFDPQDALAPAIPSWIATSPAEPHKERSIAGYHESLRWQCRTPKLRHATLPLQGQAELPALPRGFVPPPLLRRYASLR